MTTVYPLILDTYSLDDATLAQRVADLLADPATPPRLVCQVLYALLLRRPEDAVLTSEELVCLDAMDLDAQVCNGGLEQWVCNGYVDRGRETVAALYAIGALKATRILERALRALPEPLRTRVRNGEEIGPDHVWMARFGPKRQDYLSRLDDAYYNRPASEDVDTLVVAYARRHGVGRDAAV